MQYCNTRHDNASALSACMHAQQRIRWDYIYQQDVYRKHSRMAGNRPPVVLIGAASLYPSYGHFAITECAAWYIHTARALRASHLGTCTRTYACTTACCACTMCTPLHPCHTMHATCSAYCCCACGSHAINGMHTQQRYVLLCNAVHNTLQRH